MFSGNPYLQHASGLVMGDFGYSTSGCAGLFDSCTALKTPAQHDFSNLVIGSYAFATMYANCTTLQTAPDLHINRALGDHAFFYTFYKCYSLSAPGPLTADTFTNGAVSVC